MTDEISNAGLEAWIRSLESGLLGDAFSNEFLAKNVWKYPPETNVVTNEYPPYAL